MFTTRPEIKGTFGVVASTHWIASSVGMSMLEKGGNAFDACVAAGLVLQILEPQLCGPGGDLPAVFHSTRTGKTEVLCAQGVLPAGATIAHYRDTLGLDLVPGSGFLAAVVPGVFDGYMALLADHGSLDIEDVLAPTIHYARHGHPILPRVCQAIADMAPFFKEHWPTSAAVWLPGGAAPKPDTLFKNPVLADTYERILNEGKAAKGGREARIAASRRAYMQGFVAEAVGRFAATEQMDSSGRRNRGVITAQDLATWHATYEAPLTYDYANWTICKTGPWGQGPVLAQTLSILKGFDIARMDPAGPDFIHTVTEALKLAFADREVYYGDPNFSIVPMDKLLAEDYAAARRKLVTGKASLDLRPGTLPGFEEQVRKTFAAIAKGGGKAASILTREPTMAHLLPGAQRGNAPVVPPDAARGVRRGDTVHVDVIDRHGNMISATPSGGWLQSSPAIPGLGFCLNTRGQMFWLDEGLPTSLAPGKRPRTTLSPSLALEDGEPRIVFGTPGGDQQDQWQVSLFLRHVHHGMNLQEAIDQPMFHTGHFPGSFYPRDSRPGHLLVEESVGTTTVAELERRGHKVEVAPAWSAGRLTAAKRGKDGVMRAAATPRLMQAYAVGR